jgi:hypothetical protein
MTISLHAATVPSMLQLLGAARGWIAKAEASGLPEEEVVSACLISDMLPFAYQLKSMAVHSLGAFEAVRRGVFSPDVSEPPADYEALRARTGEAIAYLEALTVDEVEALRGGAMRFEVGSKRLPFRVDDFLLSFSQPNFYFHAATAYGILRAKGIKVGKIDYLGALRVAAE